MASNNKYHYYVMVMTNEGPKFVTKIGEHHTAYWDKLQPPLELSKSWAYDMVTGLIWNGYMAYPVVTTYEITRQPYRYAEGQFEWVEPLEP